MSAPWSVQAAEFLAREAAALDEQRWDDWLALYHPDAVFWMPSWRDETERVADPDTEMSLFYIAGRDGLADRVWRIRQQRSAASTPLLRTSHHASNVLAEPTADGRTLEIAASWSCFTFNPKRNTQVTFFGRYRYAVSLATPHWLILRKEIVLMNDCIPTLMDFYCC